MNELMLVDWSGNSSEDDLLTGYFEEFVKISLGADLVIDLLVLDSVHDLNLIDYIELEMHLY